MKTEMSNILEVKSVKIILVDQVQEGFDELSPVVCGGHSRREIARTSPATYGKQGFHALF